MGFIIDEVNADLKQESRLPLIGLYSAFKELKNLEKTVVIDPESLVQDDSRHPYLVIFIGNDSGRRHADNSNEADQFVRRNIAPQPSVDNACLGIDALTHLSYSTGSLTVAMLICVKPSRPATSIAVTTC